MFSKVTKILGLLLCANALGLVYTYPVFVRSWIDRVHGVWVSLQQSLSPSILFLLMNLVVGTLALMSGFVPLWKKRRVLLPEDDALVPEEEEEEE
eukprot:c21369_g1_i1 orf=391-675(+)